MLAAILITILPTLLMALLLPKIGFKIKSTYLRIALYWFAGMYLFTMITFFLAGFYDTFTTQVLARAVFTTLILNEAAFVFFIPEIKQLGKKISQSFSIKASNFFLIAVCLVFTYIFLAPHLATSHNMIYTSPVYWDFHWHAAIIQNFVYGDNFPPQDEAFPGIPMEYHFFGDLIMAMYEVGGVTLTASITFSSFLFFFFTLIAIIGISEDFFKSKLPGFFGVCLAITTSSYHIIYYFIQNKGESLPQLIKGIFTNTTLPFYMSFIPGNPFHYDGAMFNLFYFLEERHLLIAPVFLLLCLWIIVHRNNFSVKTLTVLGILMGAFFYWNVFVALMVCLGLFFVLLFQNDRKSTLVLFVSCVCVVGLQYESLKHAILLSGAYVPDITHFPEFNTSFATIISNNSSTTTFGAIVGYYLFAYGLKIILAPIGFYRLWKRQKQLALILLAFTVPIFIVINTIQISPSGIGENHKFLLTMNIILDLVTAYVLYELFTHKKRYKLLAIIFLLCLTASGVLEDVPFITSKPTVLYADYSPTSLARTIQNNTFPHANILGKDIKEIQLAGRKIFVGESAGDSVSINKIPREDISNNVYNAQTQESLCSAIGANPIDYVEFSRSNPLYTKIPDTSDTYFTAQDSQLQQVIFLDTQKLCHQNSSIMVQ